MQIWPGQPYPLGATYDGAGTNFSLFSEVAERVELCLFDDDGTETRVDLPEVTALRAGTATSRRRPGPALRLPGPRPVRPGQRACAATRPSCCSTPTPRRSTARSTGTRRCSATTSTTPTAAATTPTAPRSCPSRVVVNPFFDWGDDRHPRTPVARDGHLRGPRQGLHRAPPRHPRGAARHLRRPGPPRGHRLPQAPRRHRRRAAAGPPVRPRPRTSSSGACATTGATTRSASSRPTTTTPSCGQRGQQVQEFKQMVKALHEAGIEVILDVVYNHTAEGNHLGPDAVVQGHRQRRLLPAGRRRPALLHATTPAPATASTCATRTCCS